MIISVGISFRPLTGMVLAKIMSWRTMDLFSPPYGDGTKDEEVFGYQEAFSPPYGDGTKMAMENQFVYKFSPPCGDGTLNISQNIVKWKN